MSEFLSIINFIKSKFPNRDFIPLHEPRFEGNERKYVLDAIDSTFVSSVGQYVDRFEQMIAAIAGTKYGVATVNGTSALHIALMLAGVKRGDEVITQALTFVATANAIKYLDAYPVFIDVDTDTIGMSSNALEVFLQENAEERNGELYNTKTGRRISCCLPMHTFGLPSRIDKIQQVCSKWGINLVEDAAESLGSYLGDQHTGSYGLIGTFSFNGNKTLTAGGGGALVTNNEEIAYLAKHLTTQAKVAHNWEYDHDMVGYNYRMPNLNAALACAQLENLERMVSDKRKLALDYSEFFKNKSMSFKAEIEGSKSNYWLNAIEFEDKTQRDDFLSYSNKMGVMTRPVWNLMNTLTMYDDCFKGNLQNSIHLSERIVNIPSSAPR